jgi:hypothetical protein
VRVGPAFVAQQLPGKNNVGRRHRFAVGKARRGVDGEDDESPRRVGLDAVGEQTIEREGLVIAARQQALDRVVADIGGGQPFDDEWIEAVEGAEHALRQLAAFARRRIGVTGPLEIGRPGRVTVHGDGVTCLSGARRPAFQSAGGDDGQRAKHQIAPRRTQGRCLRGSKNGRAR